MPVPAFEALLHDALLVTALLTIPILAVATGVGAVIAVLASGNANSGTDAYAVAESSRRRCGDSASAASSGMGLCAQLFLEAVARIPQLVHG